MATTLGGADHGLREFCREFSDIFRIGEAISQTSMAIVPVFVSWKWREDGERWSTAAAAADSRSSSSSSSFWAAAAAEEEEEEEEEEKEEEATNWVRQSDDSHNVLTIAMTFYRALPNPVLAIRYFIVNYDTKLEAYEMQDPEIATGLCHLLSLERAAPGRWNRRRRLFFVGDQNPGVRLRTTVAD